MDIQALGHCVCICVYIYAQCFVVAAFYTNRYCGRATVSHFCCRDFLFFVYLFCYSNHPERWEAVACCGLFCLETGAGLLCLLVLGLKGCSPSHSSHCGFDLHFLANQQCWESLCASWSCLYVIVGEMPALEMAPMCAR